MYMQGWIAWLNVTPSKNKNHKKLRLHILLLGRDTTHRHTHYFTELNYCSNDLHLQCIHIRVHQILKQVVTSILTTKQIQLTLWWCATTRIAVEKAIRTLQHLINSNSVADCFYTLYFRKFWLRDQLRLLKVWEKNIYMCCITQWIMVMPHHSMDCLKIRIPIVQNISHI